VEEETLGPLGFAIDHRNGSDGHPHGCGDDDDGGGGGGVAGGGGRNSYSSCL